jgi:ribonucleoside-diphosphate reductase alpha chain
MGFADMLIRMGISYTDKKAETMARKIMKFIRQHSLEASRKLAARRGAFPNLRASAYARHDDQLRNATVNAIAPTGTISIIAGCSSGIEPLFSLSFTRNVLGGTKLFEMHPLFEQELKSRGLYSREIISAVRKQGSISRVGAVPEELRRVFVTTFDVKPHQHLRIQAAFQKYTDNSVSKTVNLPHMSAIDDVKDIYLEAHRLRCKGITIYRYGSRRQQALSFGDGQEESDEEHMNDRLRQQGCFSGTCDI